jgi:hypothetical protein
MHIRGCDTSSGIIMRNRTASIGILWALLGLGATVRADHLRIVDDSDSRSPTPVAAAVAGLLLDMPQAPVTNDQPALADAFKPFSKQLKLNWDDRYLYVGSNGFPDHQKMVGITAWQQQVPIPQDYFGNNAWQMPLHPVVADRPIPIKNHFLRGAIALAVNGVPIFNPQNNRGEISKNIGELDEFGGHCGRADDYHYHVAPLFLEKIVGKGKPIAIALDGYPIYGTTGPDGNPVDPKTLDQYHGKTDAAGNYAYYASDTYPFLNGGFHGQVVERGGQVDPQPRSTPIRPAGRPLRGAKITGFKSTGKDSYSLTYEADEQTCHVNYTIEPDGSYQFEFVDGDGNKRSETYRKDDQREPPPPR